MNKKRILDLMDLQLVPRPQIADGFCEYPKKDGVPCKRHAISMEVCSSHLRSIGGHLFIFDNYDPGWLEEERERYSFCRACGRAKDDVSALELCPVRRNAPEAPCPTSPDLPTRLQYRFAKPEHGVMILVGPQRISAIRHGPFAAYRSAPDTDGRDWRVLHLPSHMPVAALDSEKTCLSLMKRMCGDGVELDFRDPMEMNRDSRFHLRLSVIFHREGRCVRAKGGILTWTAHKAYSRKRSETGFYWQQKNVRVECWGPFAFELKETKVLLRNLEESQGWSIFSAPSRERAIAFSRAAAALDLDWWMSCTTHEPRYRAETRAGVGKLLAEFPDVVCLDRDLLPELPIIPGYDAVEVTIATTEGPKKVLAFVIGDHFAVHRPLNQREAGYVLLHIPTGHLAGRCDDISPLFAAAEKLASIGDWNFTDPQDIPSDLRTKAPEVLRKHGATPAGDKIAIRFVM